MKNISLKKIIRIFYVFLMMFILTFLGYVAFHENQDIILTRENNSFHQVSQVQYQIIENESMPLGIQKEYQWTIEELNFQDNTIAFYLVHHYVDVYINDELVYSMSLSHDSPFSQTIGSDWVFIPLHEDDQGKTIKVIATPVYESVRNRNIDFLVGSELDIYKDRLKQDLPQLTVSAIAIIIGLTFLGISLYLAFLKKYMYDLTYLGMFSLILGLWKLSDTRFSPLLFPHHTFLLSCLALVALMIAAIPLMVAIQKQMNKKSQCLIRLTTLLLIITAFVLIILQIMNIADFRETLFITHIMLFISTIVIVLSIILVWFDKQSSWKEKVKKGLFILCALGSIVDIAAFYLKGNSSGIIFTLLGFILYVVITGVMRIMEFSQQEKRIQEQEAELARSRISIMLSQIQPHFLYNSLNTIYHLCEKNPEIARQAISDFSEYLRVNVDSLKRTTPVPFEIELKHIQTYLSLEKMRFDEELNIIYDIQTTHFSVPSLTIQPLVENAVKHGMKDSLNHMTITIQTKEYDDHYEIHVIDDGTGYDMNNVNMDHSKSHIGIENVKNRLWEMCQGTLEIYSELGKGTHVIVHILK